MCEESRIPVSLRTVSCRIGTHPTVWYWSIMFLTSLPIAKSKETFHGIVQPLRTIGLFEKTARAVGMWERMGSVDRAMTHRTNRTLRRRRPFIEAPVTQNKDLLGGINASGIFPD